MIDARRGDTAVGKCNALTSRLLSAKKASAAAMMLQSHHTTAASLSNDQQKCILADTSMPAALTCMHGQCEQILHV